MNHANEPMFRSTQGKATRLTSRALRRRIDTYLKLTGLKKKGLSAHSLRSSSATMAMAAGATLLEIQQHLDHSSCDTTLRYLARLDQVRDRVSLKIPIKI
jgi:integrase